MRVVVSNPDGIGDVVLRLPMMRAIMEAGHELMVICRGHAEHLVKRGLGDGVKVVVVRENPYAMTRAGRTDFATALRSHVWRFGCELLVFGSYQWTNLEEWLAAELKVRRVRMNGYRFEASKTVGVPMGGEETIVQVEEAWREGKKNEALCSALLGKEVHLGDPELPAAPEDREEAERWGNELGAGWWERMKGSGFWVGCMGNAGDYYSELKDWGAPRWAEMLRYLTNEKGRGVLLLGGEPERASLEALRESSGVAERVGVAVGDMEALRDVRRWLGLTSMAEGYIGRDTGPMHIAAALKRPVVAVFGAGMWPRFVPQVTPSYSLALDVPCASCGWHCHLEESVCVKRVPVSEVMGAVDAILGRPETGAGVREARLLPMPVGLTIPKREDRGMHEQQSGNDAETMAQGDRTMDETRLDDSDVAAAMREIKQTLQQDITNLWRIVTELRGGVAVNKAELDRAEAEKATNAALIEQLRRDVAAMNAAAIEREKDFARRDESWNVRLLNATTQANASRLELAQVSDKLAATENVNRSLQSQIAHWENAHRSQLAIINEQQGNLMALQSRVQEVEGAMAKKTQAYEARIRELGAEGKQARARLGELANARSRRLLQKFGLVSRCQWEQS